MSFVGLFVFMHLFSENNDGGKRQKKSFEQITTQK